MCEYIKTLLLQSYSFLILSNGKSPQPCVSHPEGPLIPLPVRIENLIHIFSSFSCFSFNLLFMLFVQYDRTTMQSLQLRSDGIQLTSLDLST